MNTFFTATRKTYKSFCRKEKRKEKKRKQQKSRTKTKTKKTKKTTQNILKRQEKMEEGKVYKVLSSIGVSQTLET